MSEYWLRTVAYSGSSQLRKREVNLILSISKHSQIPVRSPFLILVTVYPTDWRGKNYRTENAHELVKLIKENGMKSAVAISPATPSSAISDKLGESVDMMLVMTVVPGKPITFLITRSNVKET